MKTQYAKILFLIPFLVFTSCGTKDTPISEEEGSTLANQIYNRNLDCDHPDYINVNYSHSTLDQSISSTSCKVTYISNYVDNYCYYQWEESSKNGQEKTKDTEEYWTYYENNVVTNLSDENGNKKCSEKTMDETTYKEDQYRRYYSLYSDMCDYNWYGTDVIKFAEDMMDDTESANLYFPNTYDYKIEYFSNGEGHLKLKFNRKSSGGSMTGSDSIQYEFENFFLKSFEYHRNIIRYIINGKTVTKNDIVIKFDYNKKTIKIPDLSEFKNS